MGKRNERIAARAAELVQLDVPDLDLETAQIAKEELEKAIAGAADQLKALIDATTIAQQGRWELQAELDTWAKRIDETKQELEQVKAMLAGAFRDVEGEVAQELRRRMEALEQRMMDGGGTSRYAAPAYVPLSASYIGQRPW